MAYTIKQVSDKTGILSSTLRHWAKNGLFPLVERDDNDVRYFSNKDLDWVTLIRCLRQTGLSIDKIRDYIHLCMKGDDTILERYEIMKTQREHLKEIIDEYSKAMEKVEYKVKFYEEDRKSVV